MAPNYIDLLHIIALKGNKINKLCELWVAQELPRVYRIHITDIMIPIGKEYAMNNNFSEILGARLISISTVQEATGISRKTLTDLYYRRTKNTKFDTLRKLCDYLQIPLSELIEYKPKPVAK